MKIFYCFFYLLVSSVFVFGGLYGYPEDKRPAVSLREACEISEVILAKMGTKGYYAIGVSILGDKEQSGDGAWNLEYRNEASDKISVGIYLHEDFCVVTLSNLGTASTKGYTRDGNVSKKWLEWEAKMKKEKEESDVFWDALAEPAVPPKDTEKQK